MAVVALTSIAHVPNTRGPCQDRVHGINVLCIKLLGGEMLPSPLHHLAADQEPKKFSPLDLTPQDLMVPDFPAVAQAQDLTMPDAPAVAQAISGNLVAAPVNAGSVRNTMGDNILTNYHPPLLVAHPTAPTAFGRPPAALDPVTGGHPA